MSIMDWQTTLAAVWRPNTKSLKAISKVDPIQLETLIGIDRQKQALVDNTERFLTGKPSNNVLQPFLTVIATKVYVLSRYLKKTYTFCMILLTKFANKIFILLSIAMTLLLPLETILTAALNQY